MRLLDGRYLTQIHYSIATGGCSQIYKAVDLDTGRTCAVKVGRHRENYLKEVHAYGQIWGQKGIPQLLWDEWTGEGYIVVLECLRANLAKILSICPFLGQTEELSYLAVQMISRVQAVHSVGLVHGDIKPENFALGSLWSSDLTVYILDFGSSFPYIVNGTHIEDLPHTGRPIGTAVYASLAFHERRQLSRRDDIESLAYALLEMYVPGLPWFDRTDPESFETPQDKIYEEKRSFLSCGAYLFMYPAFMAVLSYSRSLGFQETPDYELLQAMLVPLE